MTPAAAGASSGGSRPAVFSDYSGRAVSEYFRMERWEGPARHREGGESGSASSGDGVEPPFGAKIPIDPHERGPGGGMRAGALISVLDSAGGMMSGLSVLPRWIVTTNLMVRLARLDHTGPLRVGGRVLRKGRTSVVSGMVVVDEGRDDVPVASAIATMAVLEPAEMDLRFDRPVWVPAPAPPPEQVPIDDFFHIEPGSGPTTRLDLVEHLRNPWGILHGGAVAVLADEAATRATRATRATALSGTGSGVADAPGEDPTTPCVSGSVIQYVSPNRVGPIEARAAVIGDRGRDVVVRVSMHDLGAGERLTALATVTVRRLARDR